MIINIAEKEGVETLLTPEELYWLNRNGGDGWKDAKYVMGMLAFYKFYEGMFSYYKLPYESFKKVALSALLLPMDILHLWKEVKRIPPNGTYLEIGSFVGGSLILAYEARQDLNIISIDPHVHNDQNHNRLGITSAQVYEENTKNIPKTYYRERSINACAEIPDRSVDLLVVDGGHLYEECKVDLLNYLPKVKWEGVLLVHDYKKESFPGVVQAVDEVLGVRWAIPGIKDSLTVLEDSSFVRYTQTLVVGTEEQPSCSFPNESETRPKEDYAKVLWPL